MTTLRSVDGSLAALAVALIMTSHVPGARAAPTRDAAVSGYQVLHRMSPADGYGPIGALLLAPDGNFYGTNSFGTGSGGNVDGTVFRMTPEGKLKVLHTFDQTHGSGPSTGLTLGADGSLYGLTYTGGKFAAGTAFKITTTGKFTLLHSFGGSSGDGTFPYRGALTIGADGSFYGTTTSGGAGGSGTAFKMTAAGFVTVLHTFAGYPTDGAVAMGELMLASDGNFYGTTISGGAFNGGILYRMTPTGFVTTLMTFNPTGSDTSPFGPAAAPTQGADGFLYGTTIGGGRFGGYGTIYRVALDGTSYATVHDFAGGALASPPNADGSTPIGRLLLANDGTLYGTCSQGGANHRFNSSGDGMLFSLSSSGQYSVLRSFGSTATDGALPDSELTQGTDSALFGPTSAGGGSADSGTVFKLALP